MGSYTLGFIGKLLISLALIAFIAWQAKEALREYREKKQGKPPGR